MKHRIIDMAKAEREADELPPGQSLSSPTKVRDFRSEVPAESWSELPQKDKANIIVLVVMYCLQGKYWRYL